jgi:predicted RecA/RadA family phage recombinase
MRNYVQPGVSITVTATAAASSGDGVKVGNLFGIASGDAAIGEKLVLTTEGVFEMPKVSANTFDVGALAYWDDAAKVITSTASGNTRVGLTVTTAGNPSGSLNVRLDG